MTQPKILYLLATIVVTCAGLMILLFITTKKINYEQGSFIRIFPPHPIKLTKSLGIKYNSYYISGISGDNIYLGNSVHPLHALEINAITFDTTHINIDIPKVEELKLRSLKLTIDSPYYFLTNGQKPIVFRSTIKNWTPKPISKNAIFFSQAIPIAKESFVMKAIDRKSENIIIKELISTEETISNEKILEKQLDGLFCTDGNLEYNKNMHKIIYAYLYRNQYLSIDTNLNLISRSTTIDTISRAKIKPTKISSSNTFTLESEAFVVNKKISTSANLLLIQSNSIARNELKNSHKTASVIDVYNLNTDTYKFSFYIYNYPNKKLKDFKINKNMLICIFDDRLAIYQLNQELFKIH